MNNYEIANMIHNIAMEAADFATIARIKGDHEEYLRQLQFAYTLDKDAALRLQSEPDNNEWKYLYLSSAGWLAYQLELYHEVIPFIELGLSGNARGIALDRLIELKEALVKKIGKNYDEILLKHNKTSLLFGILAAADMEKEVVKIKEIGNQKYHQLSASKDLIQYTARYLIGEQVQMNALTNENGVLILQNIQRAA